MPGLGTVLLISAIGAALSAGASIYSAKKNYDATMATNAQNIDMQKATNAQAQYNLEHQHQIEMNDLRQAGLNPVLTATGGSGAGQAYLNAPQAKAPNLDLSGVGSAVNGLSHMATSAMMMEMMKSNNEARNQTLAAIADSKNAQSAANTALAVSAKNPYYDAKTQLLRKHLESYSSGSNGVNSAKTMEQAAKEFGMSEKEFKKMIHYNWVKQSK